MYCSQILISHMLIKYYQNISQKFSHSKKKNAIKYYKKISYFKI